MWSNTLRILNPYKALKESAKKKNEVPKEYRRNRKQEFLDFLLVLASCAGIVAALMYLLML